MSWNDRAEMTYTHDPMEASRAELLKIFAGDQAKVEELANGMDPDNWVEIPLAEYEAQQTRIADLEFTAGEMEVEIARLTTQVAELTESEVALQEGLYDYHRKVEAQSDRIAELERREALLTAVGKQLLEVQRLWDGADSLAAVKELNDANEKLDKHIATLTEAGFPWPEGAAEAGGEG